MPRLHRGLAALVIGAVGASALLALPTAASAASPGIVINEIESSGGVPGDWIEFTNPTSAAIDLGGYTVKDSTEKDAYAIPSGTIVEPGAYLVLDEKASSGEGAFAFGLGANDGVRLFDPQGALVDEHTWTGHATTTWGRTADSTWALTSASTKGAANTFATVTPTPTPTPSAPTTPASGVVLNEIVYDGVSGVAKDSVELYNAGSTPVDLTGWKLADDKRAPETLPGSATLAPGAYRVLVNGTDFTFGLGKGDEVVLYDATSAIVDSYAYANTAPLATWARCADGAGAWAPATAVTLGAANVCAPLTAPGRIIVNEIDSAPSDWIEFVNPGTSALDISGYEIRDNSDDHRWQFLPGSTIVAGEFLVVTADTIGLSGGAQVAFGAPIGIGSADRIRLFDASGALIDDSLPWQGHASLDGSEAAATLARCPDGVGAFVLAHPTPGASNSCVMPDVAINEIESNGDATDWVEVVNLGAGVVDMSGWTLIDNDPAGHAAETTPLPAGTVLASGEYFVFDGGTNFVFGLGNGDTATVRDATGNTVASYSYPAHAAGVWARCADGTGDFIDVAVSTKGLRNACGNPVRINEIESDGGSPDDWIELVNPTDAALDVSGIVLKDDDDTHAYAIPANTTIAARGYLVIDRAALGFGLGGGDAVRLFDGDLAIDETTWGAGHAATTWGRCPDVTGPFAVTVESTRGAANICAGEIPVSPWPGSASVTVLDEAPTFLEDSSGLDAQATADGTFLWAVDNGTGTFWKLAVAADGSTTFAEGWTKDGKRARFLKDANAPTAAGPDTEGITVADDGFVYLASERDNSAKAVNQNIVLKIDPNAPGPDVVATQQWDLTALLPKVEANLGMEAVEWIADADLSASLIDDTTGQLYDPAQYPGHGNGLFFVAVEDTGDVYAFALKADGSASLVATIDPGLAGVMALDYDTVLDVLWAVCDNGCDGAAAQITLNGTTEPAIAHFARPAGMPNVNNEGFATSPTAGTGTRAAWWFEDGVKSGALRLGTVPTAATPEVPGPGENPLPGTDPSVPLPGTGPSVPLPGMALTGDNSGSVIAPATAERGQRITVSVGTAYAGEPVTVWLYSTPVQIAAGAVDASGRIQVTIPVDAALGDHRLAVYGADSELIGWTALRVVDGALAATGGGSAEGALVLGLLMLLAGGIAVAARRRIRSA
ncbi:lamin tail domain-containing protein [Microbacterium sp. cx-55]|uniref:lamin tail domain-containing protein n=1 Tax=Microbacterium sp. cx-55 TaxID=2875948 RepID=UPI001CBABC83|nr:lamin tail domain-containing protein [Microbacterium sp. cx-55]MBZ4486962.1 lamin tail domain-containing protein [Microbacterium sp. cx-55]UGB35881.1 lamin tail domain-containing protein [Microbacterium sp. cx-55]